MKQMPKCCNMCRAPIGDVGAIVCIDGLPDEMQIWTCHRKSCQADAILELNRGHSQYRGIHGRRPDGSLGLVPDRDHPLRGEIVVHPQQIKRVDVSLIGANRRIVT